MRWKLKRWEDNVKKQFVQCIAPGQEEEFMKALEKTEKDDEEDASVPDDLKEFISVYNNRMTKFSHTIAFYRETCQDINYKPLSASLQRILHAIKPSKKKSCWFE